MQMANDSARRAVFIRNVIDFVHLHNFEGLEFDWVSPRYLEDMVQLETKNSV
jgi:GH18 family chitinase